MNRIFLEEHVHYRVDDRGGVHFRYDEEFTRNTASTLEALQDQRYINVLNSYNESFVQLSKAPPDGKNSIRAIFAAAEGLFRIMVPRVKRLARGARI